jgi:hypothetical protein
VEYLRGNATASATGLYVICRFLSRVPNGSSEDDLRKSLQVLRSTNTGESEADAAVLKYSLAVGEGLGIIGLDKKAGIWSVDQGIAIALKEDGDLWPWFRGELLHRMMLHAVSALKNGNKVPDLVVGLAWFLQTSPLRPIQLAWTAGPEPLVGEIGLEAISNSAQWGSFQRWALALGLARQADQATAKVLIPDASTAIADQFAHLPATGTAAAWLEMLRRRIPVFGALDLINELPKRGTKWSTLPPGVVLGLLKLEKLGSLMLESSDDAKDVIALGLGSSTRQVGRVVLLGAGS